MEPVSAILVFVMVWWMVLFCVLPFGLATTHEADDDEGGYVAPGAPRQPMLKKKIIITTLISLVLSGIIITLVLANIIDIRGLAYRDLEQSEFQTQTGAQPFTNEDNGI